MKLSFHSFALSLAASGSCAALQFEVSVDGGLPTLFNSIDATDMINVSTWYSYDKPQETSANTPKDDDGNGLEYYNNEHAGISVVETMDGISVAVIFDNYDNNGDCLNGNFGGNLTSEVTCMGSDCSTFPNTTFMDVLDDAAEMFYDMPTFIFRRHAWFDCRTDGYATDMVSEGDTVCIVFPIRPNLFGCPQGIRIYELDGTYQWTDLTTETIGHEVCITIGCSRKRLLESCDEDDECCSNFCTGRVPGKNFRCHFCARKQQICANTAECCQAPGGRYCNNGRCRQCPETGCPPEIV